MQPFLWMRYITMSEAQDSIVKKAVYIALGVDMDGLSGFTQAIEAVYPNAEIQHCIIHQIRNTTKFVSYKDIKELMADLKRVYTAATEEIALNELELFNDKWGKKYPKIYRS